MFAAGWCNLANKHLLLTLLRRLWPRAREDAVDFSTAYRLYHEGSLDAAEQACQVLRGVPPADKDFLNGLIAEKRGDLAHAATMMTAAVEARPAEASFRFGLAQVLGALGQHEEAIAQLERFLALSAEDDARRPIACVRAARWVADSDEARAASWLERALAVDARGESAPMLVADALYEQSRIEAARQIIAKHARAGSYPLRLRRALMLPAIYQSRQEIEATRDRFSRELDELLASPAERVEPLPDLGCTPFYLAYHNANNVELLAKLCRASRRAHSAPAATTLRRKRGQRIRIGFVSTYFFSHSVGRTTIGLIRDLPRERFEVFVFAIAPKHDPVRIAIEQTSDHYRRLPAELDEVRKAIEAAYLDVLVFADLGMHPLTWSLAHSRLAPIQVATWGHSETSGIDTVDYYLSADGVEVETAQSHYSEQLLRPKAFFLPGYARPRLERPLNREELGLPLDRRLYACLQPPFKMHPDVDAIFHAILECDPHAVIVMMDSLHAWTTQLAQRFSRTLGAHACRVRFLPKVDQQRFLATLAAVDVVLDPLYFGGCNSSCEAIALGVPVVTLPGTHLYGRFTLGLYEEIGVEEGIALSTADYVERALRFACERDYRESVRARLLERSPALFDRRELTLAFARCLSEELLV